MQDGRIELSRFLPQRSFGLKLLLVCGLALVMAIPAGFVWALVYSRSSDAGAAVAEVAQRRGGAQVVMGPAIVVPFERDVLNADNKLQTITQQVVLYPDVGVVKAQLVTERLTLGLHDVPVYTADASFTASFATAQIAQAAPANARILWQDARIYMSVTDLRGAREATLALAGRQIDLSPADPASTSAMPVGSSQRLVSGPVPWLEGLDAGPLPVSASLRVSGAERVGFAAFARDTTIDLSGDWPTPSFDGGAVPETRTVTDAGFAALWRIPYLARGSAGAGVDLSFDTLIYSSPGAALLDPANPYQSVQRALKYAPLFVGLVFLTYFLFEATSGVRAHPAQYVLVGLAQLVFYLLLLSVSEQLGFTAGFAIGAVATVLTLALYAGSVFGSRAAMLKSLAVFSALYALIYVLMRMEDYALLVGSIAAFLAIAATMWMTRRLDWYGVNRGPAGPGA
jgi:inner membrane protein